MYDSSIIFSDASIEKVKTEIMKSISKDFTEPIQHIIVNTYESSMLETRKILMSHDYKNDIPANKIEQYEQEFKIFKTDAMTLFLGSVVCQLQNRSFYTSEELKKIREICIMSIRTLKP